MKVVSMLLAFFLGTASMYYAVADPPSDKSAEVKTSPVDINSDLVTDITPISADGSSVSIVEDDKFIHKEDNGDYVIVSWVKEKAAHLREKWTAITSKSDTSNGESPKSGMEDPKESSSESESTAPK